MDEDDEIEPVRRQSLQSENRFTFESISPSFAKTSDKTSENSWLTDIPLEPINWNVADLPGIKKNRFENISTCSDTDIADFRAKNQFEFYPPTFISKPIFQFDDIEHLPEPIKSALKAGGYTKCTPIQAASIPVALSGENITVSASIG